MESRAFEEKRESPPVEGRFEENDPRKCSGRAFAIYFAMVPTKPALNSNDAPLLLRIVTEI